MNNVENGKIEGMGMIRIKKIVGALIVLFVIIVNLNKSYGIYEKEILFISSYSPEFISFKDQVKGIKDTLGDEFNLQVQYMNAKSFSDKVDESDFYNLLKYSIASYKNLEGILIGDDDALEFYLKYKEDLFKDIPASFFGICDKKNIERALKYKNVAGVREVESLDQIIELIRKHHKNVENIVFIDNDNRVKNEFEASEENALKYGNLNFEWIITNDIVSDEFVHELKKVEENSAIISLYPIHFKDVKWLGYDDINKEIKNYASQIPIYACLSYGITEGVIGGKVINHYNQSKSATEMLLKIINEETSKQLYIGDDSTNDYIFDYETLKEYNIKKRDLPKGSIILNNPNDIIYKYPDIVISLIFLFVGLICIIITLICYIRYKIRYEKKLLKAKYAAEETNRLKAHFVSNISHELKTPITVIMSVIQLVQVKNNEYKNNHNIEIINSNCQRLLRLINNIIDIEKFDNHKLKLDLENINIVNLIEDIISSINPYAKSKNLRIIFDTNDEDIVMALDCAKIERVLLNLLSNAIKFSYVDGIIYVNVNKKEENVIISIRDFGIGMSEKYLDKIFDRFIQVDNTMTRKNEGSGIGLSIVKSFVSLHNGNISVKSKENEGSEFIINLPINLIEDKELFLYDSEVLDFNIKTELSDIYM